MLLSDLVICLSLAASSILNTVVPVAGSATVTPFLAILTDPHRAIGLASFYFLLSGIIRIFVFRKNIKWQEIKVLWPVSVLACVLGASALVTINDTILLLVVLGFTIYFLLKKINIIKTREQNSSYKTSGFVGLFSGFLQGTGLAGSDLRNSYLLSRSLNISELHGTTAIVGASNFLFATIVRLFTNQLTLPDLVPLIYIFPFILIGTLLGQKILYKLNKRTTNIITVVIMVAIIIFLARKILLAI